MKGYTSLFFLPILLSLLLLSGCRCHHEEPEMIRFNYLNVPSGATAIIENQNLAGRGLLTNKAYTTWIIRGHVIADDISILGRVILDPGALLEVNGLVNVAGGAHFSVSGQLRCVTLTQIGKMYYNGADVQVNGQYTLAGGTFTYLQNSLIKVNDLRLQGTVYGLENEHTTNTNVFSVFHFNGGSPYLNRAGGTAVCGPVLFTYDNDEGASGIALNDYTAAALTAKPTLRDSYGLSPTTNFYRYAERGCTPVASPPSPF